MEAFLNWKAFRDRRLGHRKWPALSSHAGVSLEDRRRLGITDSLVRLAVGIEAVEDLIDDLDRALRG